jgi:CheY-like chemotaxis protein
VSAVGGGPSGPEHLGAATPIVLVVDDEWPITEILAGLIEDLGYTPVVAAHGRQALELARQRPPALVLTDLMMPYLDGAGLVAALRAAAAKDGRDAPPTVLISAAGAAAAAAAGADAVLHKPFDLDEVAHLLVHYLGRPPGSLRPAGEEGPR